MSKKRKPESMRRNAQRGAITRWCPGCHRKAALSYAMGNFPSYRKCRYCGYQVVEGQQHELYRQWAALYAQEPLP